MSRGGSVSSILLFLSLTAFAAGCGGGSDSKAMDAEIGGGNGQEIRAAYVALQTDGSVSGSSSTGGSGGTGSTGSTGSTDSSSTGGSSTGGSSGSSAPDPLTQAASDLPMLDAFSNEATTAVNLTRAQERVCGTEVLPAVSPLSWDARAAHAALLESEWMLTSDSFGHVWPGGELVWDRLTMSGYRWEQGGREHCSRLPESG
jgi:uncharacterized protein YkwD